MSDSGARRDVGSGVDPDEKAGRTSLGALLGEVTGDISTLFRQEVALAKAELAQSAKRAGKGAGLLSGAALTGHFALLFLSIAAWWGLGTLIGNGWSALIVGVVYAITAGILALVGRKQLQQITGAPRTADSIKQIPESVKRGLA